jgi:hypothetical protein
VLSGRPIDRPVALSVSTASALTVGIQFLYTRLFSEERSDLLSIADVSAEAVPPRAEATTTKVGTYPFPIWTWSKIGEMGEGDTQTGLRQFD